MSTPARLGLILLSAVGIVAAFPPIDLEYTALVAWIPFFFALRGSSPRLAAVLGLVHGLLIFVGTLNWLTEIFGPISLLLIFILSMFSCLFAILLSTLDRPSSSPWAMGIITATLWTGIEHFRCEWFQLRFPWITPGTALPPTYFAPWIGVYGVTFLITLSAVWIARGPGRIRHTGFLLILLVSLSCYFSSRPTEIIGRVVEVAAIQGEGLTFDEYLALSQEIDKPVDAIIWPEYALSYDLRQRPAELARVRSLLADKQASLFVVGSMTAHPDGSWSNTAILVGCDSILGSHYKNRPVHFFNDGEAGTEAPAWPTPIGTVATPICFDNDYSSVPRKAVANGAEILLIPSMDAAHWSARQHWQHAKLFRHRAAENGRWAIVSATSGATQSIDPHGIPRAELPLFEPGVMITSATLESRLTFFTRIGWLFGPITTVAAFLLTLSALFKTRKSGKTPVPAN